MPDITMCVTKTCPIREGCYRYIAKPTDYQSCSDFSHGLNGDECQEFISDRGWRYQRGMNGYATLDESG